MSGLRVVFSRALDILLRRRRDDRLSEEIRTHLDLMTDKLAARGMSRDDARLAARRAFGGVDQMKAAYRDQRGVPSFDSFVQDLRFAMRLLVKERRFTAATVLALGLGIGVNNSIFTLINFALLRDLPFAEPDRLVAVRSVTARGGAGLSYPEFVELSQATAAVAALAAYSTRAATLADRTHPPERVHAAHVSANVFDLLGRQPALGRGFHSDDGRNEAPPVAILSHGLWQRRYGADPAIVGSQVEINGMSATVVGVMPPGFKFPLITEMWLPLTASNSAAGSNRAARTLSVAGRLAGGVELPQLRTEIEGLSARLEIAYPDTNKAVRFTCRPMRGEVGGAGNARSILLTLMAAVALVLLIACANVASLLMARSASRAREVAIRTALGATRWRIVRQLLIECALLAGLGGVLGVLLSGYGARMLAVGFDIIDPGTADTTPYWVDLTMNGSAYAFVGVACLFATVAFGLGPALHVSRTDVNTVLKDTGRSGGTRRSVRRWTGAFVIAEIAMTLALLTGAGLLWRSFLAKYRSDFVIADPSRLATMRVLLPAERFTPAGRQQFVARLDERLGSLPGAVAATVASDLPLGSPGSRLEIAVEGRPESDATAPAVSFVLVGSRYFETVGLPLVRGRPLEAADAVAGREGAVVNERLAALFLGDRDPIGRRIRLVEPNASSPSPWLTIVGVARSVPNLVGPASAQPIVYLRYGAGPQPEQAVVILVRDTPLAQAVSAVREAVGTLDPSLAVFGIERLEAAVVRGRYAQWLLGSWLGIVAGIAVVLAAVGLYALTAHGVAQRTREIGLCMALGASRRQILWSFLNRALIQLAAGLALGLWGAISVGRFFQMFLGDVNPRDPATIAAVAILLILVSLLASLLPARRATRIDPMTALRSE